MQKYLASFDEMSYNIFCMYKNDTNNYYIERKMYYEIIKISSSDFA